MSLLTDMKGRMMSSLRLSISCSGTFSFLSSRCQTSLYFLEKFFEGDWTHLEIISTMLVGLTPMVTQVRKLALPECFRNSCQWSWVGHTRLAKSSLAFRGFHFDVIFFRVLQREERGQIPYN